MRGRGGGRTRRGRGGSSCDRRCGVFASGDFVWEKSTPACVVVRQLWRGNKTCRLRVSRQLRCPKVSKGRAESPLVRPQAHTPCHGGEGRADYGAGVGLAVSWGAHTFLSMAKEKCAKESQRHGDYEDGPRRCAPWASACGSPFGAVLGLGSLRSPAGKRLLLPILTAGLAMSRAMELDSYHLRLERARARLFPPSKWAGLFPSAAYRRSAPPQVALGRLKWRCLGCLDADCVASQHRKTGLIFSL